MRRASSPSTTVSPPPVRPFPTSLSSSLHSIHTLTIPSSFPAPFSLAATANRRRLPGELDDTPQKHQHVPQVHNEVCTQYQAPRPRRRLRPAPPPPRGRPRAARAPLPGRQPLVADRARGAELAARAVRWAQRRRRARSRAHDTTHYPDREGEILLSVWFGAGHWWKYMRGMVPEVLIKRCVSSFVFWVRIVGLITVGLV